MANQYTEEVIRKIPNLPHELRQLDWEHIERVDKEWFSTYYRNIKIEYWPNGYRNSKGASLRYSLRLAYHDKKEDKQRMQELILSEFNLNTFPYNTENRNNSICINRGWYNESEVLEKFIQILDKLFAAILVGSGANTYERPTGHNFIGTIHENCIEVDMSRNRFLEYSNLKEILELSDDIIYQPEFNTETNKRIDAVINIGGKLTIIEVQSGIQFGHYADDEHVDKLFGSYMYSSKIYNNLARIVMIAGGYTKEVLDRIARINENMNKKFDIVLLKTVKVGDQIILEKVDF